jgi:large subunit ribosomal protein L21
MPEGDTVELDKVLFIGDNEDVLIGNPIIKDAKVIATSLGETKGDKAMVFKYKSKVRYRKKTGHRQIYTKLSINEILKPGA